jgi:hypothetical protein
MSNIMHILYTYFTHYANGKLGSGGKGQGRIRHNDLQPFLIT